MTLQGPILLIADRSGGDLAQALTEAGAFPIVDVSWAGALTAFTEIRPAAIIATGPDRPDLDAAVALVRAAAAAAPLVPLVIRGSDQALAAEQVLWIEAEASAERLIARLSSALRLRTLHAHVIGRAQALKAERNIIAELPEGDPLDHAVVLLVGRGPHHATLSVAVGERMGVIGALSVEAAGQILNAREIDGVVIGDGLPIRSVDALLRLIAEDYRFRDLPVAVLSAGKPSAELPHLIHAPDPHALVLRAVPLIRLRALEGALKRLITSIEHKGMIDPRTGLFTANAFVAALDLTIADCAERGTGLCLARFSFEQPVDRRASLDAARLTSRLMRDADFACRQDDGAILFAFADADLRDAHVAARRLASVLKHTMLRLDRERPNITPSVVLAAAKPGDTAASLLERLAPRAIAAA